tara:strand:- start:682 stop:1641 length:960 start_codon:yes stop_codon:yes gene_type:complete
MFMESILTDNQGNTESINILRGKIQTELDKGNSVLVKLFQPGVMYQLAEQWLTVIDFMNEWEGKSVRFLSNLVPLKDCKVKFDYSNDMFFTGPNLYKENKMCVGLLDKLLPVDSKTADKKWDLLLGETNDNKDWLHEKIQKHPVLEKTFLTYFGKDTNKGYWSDDVVRPKKHTAETLGPLANRFNTQIRCSDLIDPAIYNTTHYTAMIETTIHNDFAMFSEKEAKPIISKRPFVIFGACGQLKAFRSLGFKTFDPVIDESYDLIEDKHERWTKVLDTMLQLADMDHVEVYNKLKAILNYNKDHFENNKWKRCLTWDSYQ